MLADRKQVHELADRLSLVLALTAWWGASAFAPALSTSSGGSPGRGDVAMYQSIVTKLRAGGQYYEIIGSHLRAGHYATREVFNWRTPVVWSAVARTGDGVARALLIGLGLALIVTWCMRESRLVVVVPALIMLIGSSLMLLFPGAIVMGEAWAGVLIGLSVVASLASRAGWSIALGLAALFVRELAAPYCVAQTLRAIYRRQWRLVGGWFAGAALYAVYYGRHVVAVRAHQQADDLAHASSWLELGGVPFVLETLRWNAWLLPAPQWLLAALLMLIVGAVCEGRTPMVVRLTALAYLLFFMAAGKPFDTYWGLVAGPSLAIAIGYGVAALFSGLTTRSARITFDRTVRHP
jgi:hypothetical protein